MKKIKLTRGKWTLVNNEDFSWLSQWKWGFNGFYASRRIDNHSVYMHREICKTPKGMETDHINGNKLDNRRRNLRICSSSQNKMNRKGKGLRRQKISKKWEAYINFNNQGYYLGLFKTKLEAQQARDQAVKKHFGEFANNNDRRLLNREKV